MPGLTAVKVVVARSGVTEPKQRKGSIHAVGGWAQGAEVRAGGGGCLHRRCLAQGARPGQGEEGVQKAVEIGN